MQIVTLLGQQNVGIEVQPDDSTKTVLEKIGAVLGSLQEKEQAAEKEGDRELGQWLDHTRDEVEKVMQWIGQ